jgi:hypothetical protein
MIKFMFHHMGRVVKVLYYYLCFYHNDTATIIAELVKNSYLHLMIYILYHHKCVHLIKNFIPIVIK